MYDFCTEITEDLLKTSVHKITYEYKVQTYNFGKCDI